MEVHFGGLFDYCVAKDEPEQRCSVGNCLTTGQCDIQFDYSQAINMRSHVATMAAPVTIDARWTPISIDCDLSTMSVICNSFI